MILNSGLIEIIKSIVLGIVQGITEWLPISSTGHMILVDEFMKLKMSDAFTEMFFVVIQLGSILAVIFLSEQHPVRNHVFSKLLYVLRNDKIAVMKIGIGFRACSEGQGAPCGQAHGEMIIAPDTPYYIENIIEDLFGDIDPILDLSGNADCLGQCENRFNGVDYLPGTAPF